MNLREQAKQDLEITLSNGDDFGWPVQLTDLNGNTTGDDENNLLYSQSGQIFFSVDPDTGQVVNTDTPHVVFRIQDLFDRGFSIPQKKWKVDTTDVNGIERKFVVQDIRPDYTLGLVTCLLSVRTEVV